MKRTLIVGERLPGERAVQALAAGDRDPQAWTPAAPTPDASGATQALAAALVELEGALEADRPDAVLLADDSDAALAAALVATKLLVPVEATAEAVGTGTLNARLIAQLAPTYTQAR
jgi:hypothetical protein